MKSFKNFLEEQSRADLYHGTPHDNIHSILKSGKIKPSDNKRTSLTRDRRYVESGHGDESYFVIDHDSLRHNHKITPTDWHMGGSVKDKHYEDHFRDSSQRREEAEESVKGHIPLKHVKELVINKKHYKDHLETFGNHPETANEKEIRHDMDHDESGLTKALFKGLTYKDRIKRHKSFHKLLDKHGIKLTVKDY